MGTATTTSETRDRILEAGAKAIVAKSFNGCGLNEILSAAGVPKGSFYHYFKSKEGFGVALVEKSVEEHTERVRAYVSDRTIPATERVRGFFQYCRDWYAENGPMRECLIAKIAMETAQLSEPVRAAVKCGYDQWSSFLAKAIREAQADGDLDHNADADLLADLLLNAWEGASIRMQIDRSVEPLNQFLDVALDRILGTKL